MVKCFQWRIFLLSIFEFKDCLTYGKVLYKYDICPAQVSWDDYACISSLHILDFGLQQQY